MGQVVPEKTDSSNQFFEVIPEARNLCAFSICIPDFELRSGLSRFVRVAPEAYYFSFGEVNMTRRPSRETPVERIFREVTGEKMPASIRRILLRKPKAKLKPL
jgi:hypothetical protein